MHGPLWFIRLCESMGCAATGASAALKAAADKLDDVQRGAGELYAKFAEKASTKVRPPFAAVCPAQWCVSILHHNMAVRYDGF